MSGLSAARVLLLAAGRGRRSGGPKAWRPYEGTTLLEAQLSFFRGLVGEKNISTFNGHVRFASIGPITTQTAEEMGLHVDIKATEYTIPGLVDAILESAASK